MENQTSAAEVIDGKIVPATQKRDPVGNALAQQPTTPADLLQIAVEGGADIDKLEKLMELQMRWDASEARKAYTRAMAAFRAGCPEISRNKSVDFKQTHYSHADLAGTISQIKDILTECGLSHSWRTDHNGAVKVTCILTHVDGHSEETSLVCQPDATGSKNAIQAVGSAVTYLQRYTLFAILGLASADDDDGGKPKQAREPLSRAKQAQDKRQAPHQETKRPAAQQAPPKQQSKEGTEKREFAHVCNVQAAVFGLIQEGQSLEPKEFVGLLAQAMQLAGAETIPEACEWATQNVTDMVRDDGGTRFIT